VVTPDYFRTLGARLVRGREFTAQDGTSSPLVVIVNETLAKTYWPGQDPIGKRIYLPDIRAVAGPGSVGVTRPDEIAREVIGVVKDGKYLSLSERPRPIMFWPLAQYYEGRLTLHVRSALPTVTLAGAIRREVQAIDPHLPVFNLRTLEQQKADSLFLQRMLAILLGGFGLIGLLLAALGIYGVLAYAVSQRTREIGIRVALGAQRRAVLGLIVRQGMTLAGIGISAGLVSGLGLARLMRGLFFGIEPRDPPTFGAMTVLLGCAALLGCWIPARRAARVDPMEALRYE